jgi:cell filamentation protein
MTDRYQVTGAEGEFEPGSNEQVLRNLLGIHLLDDINELELGLLAQLYEEVLFNNFPDRRLSVLDLTRWHRLWLGNVYPWAGQARSVNLGKSGFMFASAAQIARLLDEFERKCLAAWTPCHSLAPGDLVRAIAVTHIEFILIHPFRDGNGRLSRLLADVMSVQAGHDPLDYSAWELGKSDYVGAIHTGLAGDYDPMCQLVTEAMAAGKPNFSERV